MVKQQQEQPKPEISHWLKNWTQEDYNRYNKELSEIHNEYTECYKLYESEDDSKRDKTQRRLFPSDYFQIRNNGMTTNFSVMYNFDENVGKLDKYFKWLEFSKTEWEKDIDKELIKERFITIRGLLSKLST